MARRVNADTITRIQRWEGLKLEAYQDEGGVWTIGYGHTGPEVEEGLTITKAKATALLRADLAVAEDAVDSLVKSELSDSQFGALVSFVFNVGVGAFRKSTLLARLNKGDYASVPAQLARWVHAGGKRSLGLERRRAAEVALWNQGEHVASNTIEAGPERLPAGRGDVVALGGAGAAATSTMKLLSDHSEQIEQVSWFLSAPGIISIVAGVAFAGCLAYLAYSHWKRGRA